MTDAPEQIWVSCKISDWTIGHWLDHLSIYEDIKTGQCVLSSGAPDHMGPIHTTTLNEAMAAIAAHKEKSK